MNKTIANLVRESRRDRLSLTPHLSENDISKIWDAICRSIEQNYVERKATWIKNLGTFTFVSLRSLVTQKKAIVVQRPVLTLCDKLVRTHRLQQPMRPTSGEHHIMPLNYSALAISSGYDRDSIELAVLEVAQALTRAIRAKSNVEFLFRGIGVLYVKSLVCKMKFFHEFLRRMDRTENLANCMEQVCLFKSNFT